MELSAEQGIAYDARVRAALSFVLLGLLPACGSSGPPEGTGLSVGSVGSNTTGDMTTSSDPDTTTSSSSTGSASSNGEDSSAATSTGAPTYDMGDLPDGGPPLPEGCKGKIDFVIVIGEASWMGEYSARALKSLPGFVTTLENQLADFDPHIMVAKATSTWGNPGKCPPTNDACPADGGCDALGEPAYPCWALYEGGVVSECDGEKGAGVIFPAGLDAANKPCELADERRFIHEGEPDVLDALMCIASGGTSGGSSGVGWAVARAVSPDLTGPGGCNEGFLRDDALLVVMVIDAGGDGNSPYNPYVWANMVLDAKGGEQEAVVSLGILNDIDTPEPICDWGVYEGEPWAVRSMLLNFENRVFGSICADSYVPYFEEAADLVLEICDGLVPK